MTARSRQGLQSAPLRLVEQLVSRDTVETLECLLACARAGEVTGIAFGATLKGGRYITDITGQCLEQPTHARGLIAFLADQLAGLVHRQSGDDRR